MSSMAAAAAVFCLCVGITLITHSAESRIPLTQVDAGLRAVAQRAMLCVVVGVSLLVAGWLYRLLFCPLELVRPLHDVGYVAEDGRSKARAANEMRRRRRVGDVPPVYPNGWYRVLHSPMLHRGEVKSVSFLGEQLAVFRGQDGKAYVLDAYCPHLGANLAVGGRVVGNCVECPFHGWQFRGDDGKCEKIPYADKVPEIAKVRRWPSCEVNQQILVWFHCDGAEPQWSVPEKQEITNGQWVYRGRSEHFISAHIEDLSENAADASHLGHLHAAGFTSGSDPLHYNSQTWDCVQHNWKIQWEPESEPNSHCSKMLINHSLTVFGHHFSLLDMQVVARQVGPGLVFLQIDDRFFGRGVILQCVTPVEPLLQRVSHTIYYQSNVPALVPKFFLTVESIQFERDIMIWNNKKYISQPLLVKEDAAIQKHRRWYGQFYSQNSPRLLLHRDSMDF
ncbi:cholesterol 7-desaturase nvd [Nothobranchius furzeri]